jgi:hypothetical protein
MALNKLRVFNMTQYKKVLWMDGDTMVLKVSRQGLLQLRCARTERGALWAASQPLISPPPTPCPLLPATERGSPVQEAVWHDGVHVRVLQPQRPRYPVRRPVGG